MKLKQGLSSLNNLFLNIFSLIVNVGSSKKQLKRIEESRNRTGSDLW